MKKKHLLILVMAVGLAVPAAVFGQTARNVKEAVNDNAQISRDKKQIARDTEEIAQLNALLVKMDAARDSKARDVFLSTNRRARSAMRREVDEARRKLGLAQVEVGQSRRERRGERQEANMSGNLRDYAQLGDDRRDLRDDRRDRRAARNRLDRMTRILEETEKLAARVTTGDKAAVARSRELMSEFVSVMEEDLAATKKELGEDRRERREDRRERRTDRRK